MLRSAVGDEGGVGSRRREEDESAHFFPFLFWGGGCVPFPVELNLRLGCDTLLCLFSYQALASGS